MTSAPERRFRSEFRVPVPSLLVPALRRTSEHLYDIVVHTVVEQPLKGPRKLRAFQVSRMQLQVIGMQAQILHLAVDYQFDAAVAFPRRKIEERMLVACDLLPDLLKQTHPRSRIQ